MNKSRVILSLLLGAVMLTVIVFLAIKVRFALGWSKNGLKNEAEEDFADGCETIMGKFGE